MSELPTAKDLECLTPRAIVTYATRCARRIQPLYLSEDIRQSEAVERAICLAESFARDVRACLADTYDEAAYAAADAMGEGDTKVAAYAAFDAAQAAAYAAEAAHKDTAVASAAACAADASFIADSEASWFSANDDDPDANAAAIRDYNLLLVHYPRGKDPIGAPVDLSLAGPLGSLWPDGEPPWFSQRKEAMLETLHALREVEHPRSGLGETETEQAGN